MDVFDYTTKVCIILNLFSTFINYLNLLCADVPCNEVIPSIAW